MKHYLVTVEGPNFKDLQEMELPRLPAEGEPLETRYGTGIVADSQATPDDEHFDGKVTCRLP
jgi:hypothetical protein